MINNLRFCLILFVRQIEFLFDEVGTYKLGVFIQWIWETYEHKVFIHLSFHEMLQNKDDEEGHKQGKVRCMWVTWLITWPHCYLFYFTFFHIQNLFNEHNWLCLKYN